MDITFKKILLSSKDVKSELGIAFGLILLALLVFMGYLFPGASSWFQSRNLLNVVVMIVFFIVVIGFIIIVQVIEPVIKISREAKMIADGNFNREIKLFREDEIGQLAEALNRMTYRMKQSVEELKTFSETTEEVNKEMNRRVLMLSNLLQLSSLIAQNAQLSEVIQEGMRKCIEVETMNRAALILKDREVGDYFVHSVVGDSSTELKEHGIKSYRFRLGQGLLGKALLRSEMVIIDQQTVMTSEVKEFIDQFVISNALLVPLSVNGNVYGLLVVGNNQKNFIFANAEREIYQLIAQQVAIACSNELLRKQVEKLEAVDRLTGLFNGTFIRSRLEDEIKKAVHGKKPCSFVLMSIDHFDGYRQTFGHIMAESFLVKIAAILKENVKGQEKVARFADNEFAIILPEKNKRQSIDLAENIRKKIEHLASLGNQSLSDWLQKENSGSDGREDHPAPSLKELIGLNCSMAVTENPIDGITANDLIVKAEKILQKII